MLDDVKNDLSKWAGVKLGQRKAPVGEATSKEKTDPTFKNLLQVVKSNESAYSQNMSVAEKYDKQNSPEAHWWRVQASALCSKPSPEEWPGIDFLEAICQSRFGSGLTGENLRRIRGDLIASGEVEPADLDSMTIQEVVAKHTDNIIQRQKESMAKEKASVHIDSVRGDVTISQDQSGGTTGHTTRTGEEKKPSKLGRLIIVIGVVASIVTILAYLGIKPTAEEKMADSEEKISIGSVNGDAVVSQGQSGGITAHTVNVNVNKQRAISPEIKIEKEKRGDKFILRAILKQTTGLWDPSTKFELRAEMSGPYETADIVKGLPEVKFEVKTLKDKENGVFAYSTRTAPLTDEPIILEIQSASDIDLVELIVKPLAEIRDSK